MFVAKILVNFRMDTGQRTWTNEREICSMKQQLCPIILLRQTVVQVTTRTNFTTFDSLLLKDLLFHHF